jgi:hypothetical protein
MMSRLTCLFTIIQALALLATPAFGWEQPFASTIDASDATRSSATSFDALLTIVWAVKLSSVVLASCLLIFSAQQMRTGEYDRAFYSFVAAIIAGISTFLAENLFLV